MSATDNPPPAGLSADEVLGTGWWRLSEDERDARAGDLGVVARRAYARQVEHVAQAIVDGTPKARGYSGAPDFVMQQYQLSRYDAQALIDAAKLIMPSPDTLGGTGEPLAPATARALADGALNAGHMRIIGETLRKFVDHVERDTLLMLEDNMAGRARIEGPEDLRTIAREIQRIVEQNTPPDEKTDLAQKLPVRDAYWREGPNGMWKLYALLDPESKILLEKLCGPPAKPHPATDEGPDPRPMNQRRGDAVAELIRMMANRGELPDHGGLSPHLALVMRWEDIMQDIAKKARQQVLVDGYGVTSPEAARRLACDVEVLPVMVGAPSQDLDVAHAQRTAPAWLRRHLHLRDKGCTFPSCDRPPEFTVPHHVTYWTNGGKTTPDNLTCLRNRHHNMIHHTQWTCETKNGKHWFTPRPIGSTRPKHHEETADSPSTSEFAR